MRILSLFDGISCARVALERAGFAVSEYFASEIEKNAMIISKKNFPDIIQIGSVTDVKSSDYQNIDLLIGGSPCQDLSIAKQNRQGLSGSRSGLFWEYVRVLNEVNPKYFILENVNSMPASAKNIISLAVGVEPVMINANLVSAQNRARLFWVGALQNGTYKQVFIPQPTDQGILLQDILERDTAGVDKAAPIRANYGKMCYSDFINESGYRTTGVKTVGCAMRTRNNKCKELEISDKEKANSITSVQTDSMGGYAEKIKICTL